MKVYVVTYRRSSTFVDSVFRDESDAKQYVKRKLNNKDNLANWYYEEFELRECDKLKPITAEELALMGYKFS